MWWSWTTSARTRWTACALCSTLGKPNCYIYRPIPPDFNPIEKCWAQIKQRLRAAKARSLSLLEQHLSQALSIVTPQNIQAYFRHCGYAL